MQETSHSHFPRGGSGKTQNSGRNGAISIVGAERKEQVPMKGLKKKIKVCYCKKFSRLLLCRCNYKVRYRGAEYERSETTTLQEPHEFSPGKSLQQNGRRMARGTKHPKNPPAKELRQNNKKPKQGNITWSKESNAHPPTNAERHPTQNLMQTHSTRSRTGTSHAQEW